MVYQNGKAVAISQASAPSTSAQDIYSTEEQVIGRWIDGRPIYRRVFTGKIGSTLNVWNSVADSFIPYLEKVISLNGAIDLGYGYVGIPYVDGNGSVCGINYIKSATGGASVGINTNTSAPGYLGAPMFAVIKYTKTTDESIIAINSTQEDAVFRRDLQNSMLTGFTPATTATIE